MDALGRGRLAPALALRRGGPGRHPRARGRRAGAPEEWRRGSTAIVDAIPVADGGSDGGGETLAGVRDAAHATGADVRVGGGPASTADFIDAVYGSFPLMVALIGISTFLLLARAFRSLLLPLKAIILNVLSVAAAGACSCSAGSTATAPS